VTLFDDLRFEGNWRRYQRAALSAFEHDRADGRQTHLVAPPGSGKTLLVVEMIRRLGRRALVLAPNHAVQMQWPRAVREFGAPAGTAGPEPGFPIACMTYDGLTPDRLAKLRAAQVGTVVLDECHHLTSAWAELVAAALGELGDVHTIALTSTPPDGWEATITVPAPAVVREGHLAPYVELAWLTEPVESERRWLAEHPDRPDDARVLLGRSRAKEAALVEVLAAERSARGDDLRGLVLCELEHATEPPVALGGVLDPETGTARHALGAVAAAGLRPLLVGERGLCCLPADADALLAAAVEQAKRHLALPEWAAEPDGVLVSLRSHGAEWVPRAWIEVATRVFVAGACDVLVGTRALLAEGRRSPAVNCLVDLSLGPADRPSLLPAHGKVATNWDVVCAVPGGGPDYERFARGHAHLFAPADDGELEAGPSHAHVELGPPTPEHFAEINRASVERAAAHDEARERWRVDEPYRDVVLRTLVVRGAEAGTPAPPPISQRVPLAAGLGGAAAFAAAAAATGVLALLAGLVLAPAGLAWAAARLRRAARRLPEQLGLEPAAHAVADAYAELGELDDPAIATAPRESGYVRCRLPHATPGESERFTSALGELLSGGPSSLQVTRPLPSPDGALTLLGRVLLRRAPFPVAHHPIPSDLARTPERAEAFTRCWRRYVGPTMMVAGQAVEAGYESRIRDVWT
jgi:hypothetical protein